MGNHPDHTREARALLHQTPTRTAAVAHRGHRGLHLTRKGGRRAVPPLAPATAAALNDYLAHRAQFAGLDVDQLRGPLLATTTGRSVDQRA